jgi:hypothetical protein
MRLLQEGCTQPLLDIAVAVELEVECMFLRMYGICLLSCGMRARFPYSVIPYKTWS